ncbi:MAG: DNA polymerase III subunit delta [Hyphomicrobiaceae bacterium]
MVSIKPAQANSFLSKPDAKFRAILFYGPDSGMVGERAQKLAALLAAREQPPGEVVRLDDTDLEGNPDRLLVELLTVPMFGGRKIVRTSTSRRVTAATLQPLLEGGELEGTLIVEAGALRNDDKLKAMFEKSAVAAAVVCYADESTSLDGLVSDVLKDTGLEIAPEARQELVDRLGADRALSRSEIEKLTLYAHGKGRIALEDVEAVVGDASDLTVDLVVTAAATGDVGRALEECDRAVASGENPQSVMLAAERHFHRLHKLKTGVDAGRTFDELVRFMRPPLPFKAKSELERQLRLWSAERAGVALARITEAVRRARTTGADEAVIAERLLIEIARLARAGTGAGARRSAP